MSNFYQKIPYTPEGWRLGGSEDNLLERGVALVWPADGGVGWMISTGSCEQFYTNDFEQAIRFGEFLDAVNDLEMYDESEEFETLIAEVHDELEGAIDKYPPFNTAHEGYAILLEEVDELWQHVKVKQGKRDVAAMRKEAIQIAAMALRFALELGDERGQR